MACRCAHVVVSHAGGGDRAHVGGYAVKIVPLTLPEANRVVAAVHRHHAPIPGGFGWFCLGAVADGTLRGAAIAGRPTNRNNDDGGTVEVLRVASDGTSNVCSALLGACQRAAKAVGAWRILTYTLESEPGSSLRAVGWVREEGGIRSFWDTPGTRSPGVRRDHFEIAKVRWVAYLKDAPTEYLNPFSQVEDGAQSALDFGGVA